MRTWIVPGLGAIALAASVAIWLWPRPSVGWFAYAPLSNAAYLGMVPDYGLLYGLAMALALIGVALLAGWVGFRLGGRKPT